VRIGTPGEIGKIEKGAQPVYVVGLLESDGLIGRFHRGDLFLACRVPDMSFAALRSKLMP
jgi:hypothetical protein